MLSQVLSLLSVGSWSPHVDAKTYKTNPFGTDMFFFLLLISYIAWCSAFTRLSAWSGNCICSPEVSSPRLRCEKKRSYHILESCLSACSYELFETNIRILITLIHIALIPTTLLHHSWCFRTKQHKLYKYSYTYTGTWQAVSFPI